MVADHRLALQQVAQVAAVAQTVRVAQLVQQAKETQAVMELAAQTMAQAVAAVQVQ